MQMMEPLSDEETDELETFLLSDAASDETMTLDMVDGYLTAIAIGPVSLVPSQWLPGIWGPSEDDVPDFESSAHAERILQLIMRHMNGIIAAFEHDPDTFEPFFNFRIAPDDGREHLDGESWAYGFMRGVEVCRKAWQPLFDDVSGAQALQPVRLLGASELTQQEGLLTGTVQQREELSKAIPASVAAIYRWWLPSREAAHQQEVARIKRSGPKIGRNDSCPCGSGKKFKKCCGDAKRLH